MWEEHSRQNQQHTSLTGARILIVDDDPLNVKMTTFLLEDAGYSVEAVSNGVEALQFLETHSVDLVLLDVMMPGVDGYEICRRIRQSSPTPIMFISAKGSSNDRIHGLKLGADDYLAKPFGPAELLARVQAVLRRSLVKTDSDPSLERELPVVGQQRCPYLGLKADRTSVGTLPSTAHRCYATDEATSISRRHQIQFCLGPNYEACRRYVEELPPAATVSRGDSYVRLTLTTLMSAAVVVMALFFVRRSGSNDSAFVDLRGGRGDIPVDKIIATTIPADIMADIPVMATRTSVPATATPVPATATAMPSSTSEPTPTPTAVPATATPTATAFAEPATVTARVALNVRSGPDTTYGVITALRNGDSITVLGQDEVGEWIYVRLADGRVGWSAREYTDFNNAAPVILTTP